MVWAILQMQGAMLWESPKDGDGLPHSLRQDGSMTPYKQIGDDYTCEGSRGLGAS